MRALVIGLLACCMLVAQIRMPVFQRIPMDNGAVLVLMPKQDLPLVTLRVSLRGGAEADPAGLEGLASITANLLTRGTLQRSREQLAEDLDQLGLNVNVQVTRKAAALELQFLARNTQQVIALLGEMLTKPRFDEQELTRLVAQRVDAAKVSKDQPQLSLREYFPAYYFGKQHPYGRPANGDELSLPKITRAAVVEYWKSNFVGKNLVVVAAGQFDAKLMESQMRKLFGSLPAGNGFKPAEAAEPKRGAPRLLLVDLPGATQTYFAIAQPGISRTSPDRTRIELVNTLFGGRFTSMLNDALRVESGLTYGANSTVQLDRLPGTISIATFTKTESTAAAIDLALQQLDKLQAKGIDAEQLASAKAYVKGEYPTRNLETIDQLSGVLTDFELYGLNRGEVDDLMSRIDSVTVEQANETARKYFRNSGLVFVLIGDAGKIRKIADKYAKEIKVIQSSEPGF